MLSSWEIQKWPTKKFDVFLSHVCEDRDCLVSPVYESLKEQGIIPWIDTVEFPSAQRSHAAIREQLPQCSRIVYFLTPSQLEQGRGWTSMEATLANIIESHCQFHTQSLYHFQFPLLFVDFDHETQKDAFERSVWQPLFEIGIQCPFDLNTDREKTITWCVKTISALLDQEDRRSVSLEQKTQDDDGLRAYLDQYEGLRDWLTSLGPRDFGEVMTFPF